ncbi:MAG: NUDIX domain-containing protein [Rhodospirillales bacterium]|jgi:ADP-ribose pyrophosphatase|nr:NUDIX domain-containing protein [Rhodospirillales bacterium]
MRSRPTAPLPADDAVQVETERRVWDGRFPLDVVRFRQRRFDGGLSGLRTWELWRRGRAAAVLPYDPDADAVVLIEQFRLPALAAGIDPVLVELPAGLCEAEEDPAQTIVREAVEETGLAPDRLARIAAVMLSPGGTDECCTLFAGRVRLPPVGPEGLLGHAGLADEDEDIRVRVWPAAAAIEAALAGRFPNALTMLALLWLGARRDGLRTEWSDR